MVVRLEPLCSERRVTAPQAPLTPAAAWPIHCSTGQVSIVVSLHDPSYFSLGLIRRLTCYRAAKWSTRFPQKTGLLRRFRDLYVALFTHFIPPGVWEAVYIIEALLQNRSNIQPDTVFADTQGQSTPVFAFTHLLGIQLMPRIRNWKDLRFYRPAPHVHYQHI